MGLLCGPATCSHQGQLMSAPSPFEAQLHALRHARIALYMSRDALRIQCESCMLWTLIASHQWCLLHGTTLQSTYRDDPSLVAERSSILSYRRYGSRFVRPQCCPSQFLLYVAMSQLLSLKHQQLWRNQHANPPAMFYTTQMEPLES